MSCFSAVDTVITIAGGYIHCVEVEPLLTNCLKTQNMLSDSIIKSLKVSLTYRLISYTADILQYKCGAIH